MKRIVLSVLAISMLAATSLQGQAAPLNRPAAPQAELVQVDWKKPSHKYDNRRDSKRYDNRHTARKYQYAKRHQWKRGQRYSDWRRHQAVRDYRRHGLKRPAPGQQWIKVDNDYLLVSIASGLIAGIIAAR